MTNLELANRILENLSVHLELQLTHPERVPEIYMDEMLDRCEDVELNELFEEYVSLEEFDSINDYIIHNIRAQIESKVDLNERYATISVIPFIKFK